MGGFPFRRGLRGLRGASRAREGDQRAHQAHHGAWQPFCDPDRALRASKLAEKSALKVFKGLLKGLKASEAGTLHGLRRKVFGRTILVVWGHESASVS